MNDDGAKQQKRPRLCAGAESGLQSERSLVGLGRWLAGRSLQFLLVAIELAHHIGVNGPRCDLRSLRLLAFAVGLLVGRANEGALDKSSSTYKSNTKQYQMLLIDTRQFVE